MSGGDMRVGGSGGVDGAGRLESGAFEAVRARGPEAEPEAEPAPGGRAEDEVKLAALPFGRSSSIAEIGPKPKQIAEPSGIVYHPDRGTLFAVGDRGHVVEMTRDGEVLSRRRISHLDLEGVTIGPKGRV